MWQFAASLVARALTGTERAQALSRWAGHVLQQEGSVWRCAGILTSAGCLAAAVQVGTGCRPAWADWLALGQVLLHGH